MESFEVIVGGVSLVFEFIAKDGLDIALELDFLEINQSTFGRDGGFGLGGNSKEDKE